MKKRTRLIAVTVAALHVGMVVFPVGVFAANSGNMVQNGGFRRWTDTTKVPDKWDGTTGFGSMNSIINDAEETLRSGTEEGNTGNNVLKTISNTSVKPVMYALNKKTPMMKDSVYKVKMFLRMKTANPTFFVEANTKSDTTRARVGHMTHLNPENGLDKDTPPSGATLRIPVDTWVENEAFYTQPVDTTGLQLVIKSQNAGDHNVYIDNVGVYKVDLDDPVFNQSFEAGGFDMDPAAANTAYDVPVEPFEHWGWEEVPDAFTLDTSEKHTGDNSVKVTGGKAVSFEQKVAVKSNTDYYLQFYSKGDAGLSVRVNDVELKDSAQLAAVNTVASGDWMKNVVKVNSGDHDRLRIVIRNPDAGVSYLDDISLTTSEPAEPAKPGMTLINTAFTNAAGNSLTALENGAITCTATTAYTGENAPQNGTMIAAYYQGNKFLGAAVDATPEGTNGNWNFSSNFILDSETPGAVTAKVFIWDSLAGLYPWCAAGTFPQ